MNLVDTPMIQFVIKNLKRRVAQGEDIDDILKSNTSFGDEMKEEIKKAVMS